MIQGFSAKEMLLIRELEEKELEFFTAKLVKEIIPNNDTRRNLIRNLKKKNKIIRLNRYKYYKIPLYAKHGTWRVHPFILVDEICDSKDYVIGGWSAANYWGLSDQVPAQVDVYTTRRQGKVNLLGTRILFHRSTRKKTGKSIVKEINKHRFIIMSKEESMKWMSRR